MNCASNASKAEGLFRNQLEYIKAEFPESEFVYVKRYDSIPEIAAKFAESHSIVVACGGDGTVNRVANGILGTKAVLGVLPLGSGNDFAKSIGLSRDFLESCRILKLRKVRNIDVIRCRDEIFLNTFGVGLDGLTNHYASKLSFKQGFLRYFVGGLMALFTSKSFHVSYKQLDQLYQREVWMAVIANGKIEGGRYLISPTSNNHDGFFEVILVSRISRIRLIIEFIKLSFGFSFDQKVVQVLKLKEFSFSACENQKCHADGEQIQESMQFQFHIKEGVLPVIVK
ncbi:MAG: diacylglycerol kinase family protein [Balneolaceae bacterium]